jgi:hypothetical protein
MPHHPGSMSLDKMMHHWSLIVVAPKNKKRVVKPKIQAHIVLLKKWGMLVESCELDTSSFNEYKQAFLATFAGQAGGFCRCCSLASSTMPGGRYARCWVKLALALFISSSQKIVCIIV